MKLSSELIQKSHDLVLKIIEIYKYLNQKYNCVLSKRLLRSGTSLGENIVAIQYCVSKKNFRIRISTALKEAEKTKYWLEVLMESGFLTKEEIADVEKKIDEIIEELQNTINSYE